MLRERVGIATDPHPPVTLASVELRQAAWGRGPCLLRDARLPAACATDAANGSCTAPARAIRISCGRARAGRRRADAVVYPRDASRGGVARRLRWSARSRSCRSAAAQALSVGVSPQARRAPRCPERPTPRRSMRCSSWTARRPTVRVQGGIRAPRLERRLSERGLHARPPPTASEFVSIGGSLATRSAGRHRRLRLDRRHARRRGVAAPPESTGSRCPHSAAGPDLRELIAGSEGTLGVVEEATLRCVAPRSAHVRGLRIRRLRIRLRGAARASPAAGAARRRAALRRERDARSSWRWPGAAARSSRRLPARPGARLRSDHRDRGRRSRRSAHAPAHQTGAARRPVLRRSAAARKAWLHGPFRAPYLRDELMTLGVMVETMETATLGGSRSAAPRCRRAPSHHALDAERTPGRDVSRLTRLRDGLLALLHRDRAPG